MVITGGDSAVSGPKSCSPAPASTSIYTFEWMKSGICYSASRKLHAMDSRKWCRGPDFPNLPSIWWLQWLRAEGTSLKKKKAGKDDFLSWLARRLRWLRRRIHRNSWHFYSGLIMKVSRRKFSFFLTIINILYILECNIFQWTFLYYNQHTF